MKRIASIGILSVLSLITIGASGQEKDPELAKKIALSYELQKPGTEHKQLEGMVGTWDQEIKIWTAPGAKPIIFKGRCENRMILGGRFLMSEGKSSGMGMTVETLNIIGFDRRNKKFTSVSFDTMGTYYVSAAGPFNEAKKAVVMYGKDIDPLLGTQKYDIIHRIVDTDQYITEVVFKDPVHTHGQPEFKEVEVTHTRVK